MGVGEDGYRHVLGARICESESEEFWTSLFEDLKTRGLYGVLLVISDGHKGGIRKAVMNCFLGCSWQYCRSNWHQPKVHFVRNVLKKLPQKRRKEIAEMLREHREDPVAMMSLARQLEGMGFPEAAGMIDQHYQDLFNFMAFPKAHWTKIRTTNLLENTNRKLKQRSKVVGAFTNDASPLRLAGTLLTDQDEE